MNKLIAFIFIIGLSYFAHSAGTITVLIDPGHGGKDPGHLSLSPSLKKEKELNLLISLKLGDYLKHNLSNVNVIYTRTEDVFVSLDDRVYMANTKNVNYMISIHCNGSENTSVCGTETHIHDFNSKSSYEWALMIEKQFKTRAGRKSRGVKTGADIGHSLQILKFTKMPTVLVECGFLTNEAEAKYLNTSYGQEIIASAIFRASREFFKSRHPNINFSPAEKTEQNVAGNIVYKVQIMSSIDPLETDIPEFKKLAYPVERVLMSNANSMYKYKYYIGPFDSKKDAKKAQKEVQDKGYKDAFIVQFE